MSNGVGMSSDDIIMTLRPTGPRRWSGILAQLMLGVVLMSFVFSTGLSPTMRLFFALLAGAVLYGAFWMRAVTLQEIQLTERELRINAGRVLTTIDNIESVERGAFAFKPSNGFLVRLKKPCGKGWAPGVWWQRGRMLGIGGTMNAGQSRGMADTMAAMLIERRSEH